MVMQYLKTNGDICRADVIDLLHVTPSQAYRILQKLADSGEIYKSGSGAGTKYLLSK